MFLSPKGDFERARFDPQVCALRRPKLLMQAVRHGLSDYPRSSLRKKFGLFGLSADQTKIRLLALEAEMEQHRKTGAAGYRFSRHIEVLVTLFGETALLG